MYPSMMILVDDNGLLCNSGKFMQGNGSKHEVMSNTKWRDTCDSCSRDVCID